MMIFSLSVQINHQSYCDNRCCCLMVFFFTCLLNHSFHSKNIFSESSVPESSFTESDILWNWSLLWMTNSASRRSALLVLSATSTMVCLILARSRMLSHTASQL